MFANNWIQRRLNTIAARSKRGQLNPQSTAADVCEVRRMLTGIDPAADPDDQISEATVITLPESGELTINASLEFKADVNLYAVDLKAGDRIHVDVDGGSDVKLRLFNAAGQQLRVSFQGRGHGLGDDENGADAYLSFPAPADGRYYFGVSQGSNRRYDVGSGVDNISDLGRPTTNEFQVQIQAEAAVEKKVSIIDPGDTFLEAHRFEWNNGIRNVNRQSLLGQEIADAHEVKMYRIEGSAGDVISFDVDGYGGFDTLLRLFDAQGNEIRAIDDRSAPDDHRDPANPPSGKDPFLHYRLRTDGPYYLGISSATNRNYNPVEGSGDTVPLDPDAAAAATGTFDLHIRNYTRPIDDTDPDDQFSEAAELDWMLGEDGVRQLASRELTFVDGTDVSLVKFELNEGDTLWVETDSASGQTFDPLLRLFDASGKQLRIANRLADRSNDNEGDAGISYRIRESGTYYVGISDMANWRYNPETGTKDPRRTRKVDGEPVQGTLTLNARIDGIPGTADPYDTISEAIVPEFDLPGYERNEVTISGQTLSPAEVRMYRIDGNAGDSVTIDIDSEETSDLVLTLFDANGKRLRQINDRSAPGETGDTTDPALHFRLPEDGPFYIGISEVANRRYDAVDGTGDRFAARHVANEFSVTIKNHNKPVRDDDADDQISEATPIDQFVYNTTTGEAKTNPRSGRLEAGYDVNIYSIEVYAGDQVDFELWSWKPDATSSSARPVLRLFDATGEEMSLGGDSLSHTFDESGTYFIGVSQGDNRTYNPLTGKQDYFTDTNSGVSYSLEIGWTPKLGSYDPQDTLSEAKYLGKVPAEGSIATPQSVAYAISLETGDWRSSKPTAISRRVETHIWSFDAEAGQDLTVDLYSLDGFAPDAPPEFGASLRLFDAEGEELRWSTENKTTFRIETTGRYYIGVSSANNHSYDPVSGLGDLETQGSVSSGQYQLTISNSTSIGVPQPDADDFVDGAIELPPSVERAWILDGVIDHADDVDVYSLYHSSYIGGSAGGRQVRLVATEGSAVQLEFVDFSGNPISLLPAGDDNPKGRPQWLDDSHLRARIPQDLYARVSSGSATTGFERTDYQLQVIATDFAYSADDDGNYFQDQFLGLAGIGLEFSANDWISKSTDVDYWSFYAKAGEVVDIDIDTNGEIDTHIKVLKTVNGNVVVFAESDTGAIGGEPDNGVDPGLRFTAPEDGNYRVAVSTSQYTDYRLDSGQHPRGDGSVYGVYSIRIKSNSDRVPPNNDPDDTIDEATVITIDSERYQSEPFAGEITSYDDVNMYRINVESDGGYRIGFDDFGDSPLTPILELFEMRDGELVRVEFEVVSRQYEDRIRDSLWFEAKAGDTLYVGVSAGLNVFYDAETGGDDYGVPHGELGSYAFRWYREG